MNDQTVAEAAQRELPRYRSHKTVHALKLATVEEAVAEGHTTFVPEDERYAPMTFSNDEEVVKRCRALLQGDPGYYVVYPDGFRSWSPTEAFETGYSELTDA